MSSSEWPSPKQQQDLPGQVFGENVAAPVICPELLKMESARYSKSQQPARQIKLTYVGHIFLAASSSGCLEQKILEGASCVVWVVVFIG